jgi:hypothetical protein
MSGGLLTWRFAVQVLAEVHLISMLSVMPLRGTGGLVWIRLEGKKTKRGNCLKMVQNPTRQLHAVLAGMISFLTP